MAERMIHGIIGVFDEQNLQRINTLREEVGISAPEIPPHLTFHTTYSGYSSGVAGALETFARTAFDVFAPISGVGVFTGPEPVLYLAVVRSPALNAFHRTLWTTVAPFAQQHGRLSHPEHWVPHITLARGTGAPRYVAPIAERVSDPPLSWNAPIKALAIFSETPSGFTEQARITLIEERK